MIFVDPLWVSVFMRQNMLRKLGIFNVQKYYLFKLLLGRKENRLSFQILTEVKKNEIILSDRGGPTNLDV